jgi:hypothetical protein
MRAATIGGFLVTLCALSHALSAQVKVVKNCPVLTDADAAAMLGAGTKFVSGFEAPASQNITLRCEFAQGTRTLTVQTTPTMGGKAAWEALRKIANGTLESGLGDYAYTAMDDGAPELWAVKGAKTLEMSIGNGGTAADLPKLKALAVKLLPKI